MAGIKRWNGSTWVAATVKRWNAAWVPPPVKQWTGTVWRVISEYLTLSGTYSRTTNGVGSNAPRCGFTLNTDGTVSLTNTSGVYQSVGTWLSVAPNNINDYEMKWTYTGTIPTTNPGSSGGAYQNMGLKTWEYPAGTNNQSCALTVTVRKDGDVASEVSCTVNLAQTWEP